MSIVRRAIVWFSVGAVLAATASAQGPGINTGGNTQAPIPVIGRVALDDGSPLPHRPKLELVCPPHTQVEGTTEPDGGFSFELGSNRFMAANDAGISTPGAKTGFGGTLQTGSNRAQVDGMSILALEGCFLRAALAGYTSDVYDMNRIRAGDGTTNVGTLFLHPLARSSDTVVSSTSLNAPKDAQKSLGRARDRIEAREFIEAERELRKAVKIYPKYADAWQELGGVLQAQKKSADARQAYLKAVEGDAAFAKPRLSLALLSAQEKKWQDSLDNAAAVIKIDPKTYPQAYYYSAVAYYNLGNSEKAFENAKKAVELDTRHSTPLAEKLLGVLYFERGDYASATEQYRNCIEHMGDAPGVEAVKKLLAQAAERAQK